MNIRGPVIVLLLASACGPSAGKESDGVTEAWRPLSATEPFAGKTREEWAIEWARWFFASSDPDCRSAAGDETGNDCGLFQDPQNEVFFLSFSVATKRTHRCAVPAGKAIGVPLALLAVDDADPSAPARSDEQLIERARALKDSMRDLDVRADDDPVIGLDEYGIDPIRFDYHVPPAPNYYSCNNIDQVSDRTVDPAYLAGYFVIFDPPSAGVHQLSVSSILTPASKSYLTSLDTKLVVGDAHD